jgi:hypothetical protein
MNQIKNFLFELLPRAYRVRTHNRQLRREIEANPAGALVVWEREASSQLYFVFHGMAGALGIHPLTALRESGLIQNNLILLKDFYRFFYHAGLNPEIPDVDAIAAHLRRCREKLPQVQETFCVGPSAGGYAAIMFGHYLAVDIVYAFAPATQLNLKELEKYGGSREIARITEERRDLAKLLSNYNGRTHYKIFYCHGCTRDRLFAEHLRDSPGVELYPQPGNTHNAIQAMYESGRLSKLFQAGPSGVTAT